MSRFTTRVELYGTPSYEDYNKLHAAMKQKGFSRTIGTQDNKTLMLPHAEYNSESSQSTKEVLNLAISAASTVWKDFAVLVTRTDVSREWHNLKEAK